MLPQIEIVKNNRPLDLGDLQLNMKFFILDPDDLGARGNAVSYNFKIPVSKYNLGVLGIRTSDWQTINNYKIIKDVSIIVNSDTLLTGELSLNSFDNDFIGADFKSEQWDWAKAISNLDLADLKNYKVPYTYITSDIDDASIDAYTNDRDASSHINFPVVPRAFMYKPREILVYTLTIQNERDVPPPDGSYKVVQSQINITIANGKISTLINLKEGYYKLFNQVTLVEYDVELFIKPVFDNKEINVLNFEDVVPSFYTSSVLKKIFIEQNIRLNSSIFTDPILKDLMMTYEGEQFQWNWERFGAFVGNNPNGRSKILTDYRYTPTICPGVVDYHWDILTGFQGVGLCNSTGIQAMPDFEAYSNNSQTNSPGLVGINWQKRYFIMNIPSPEQNLGGFYKASYGSTELKNRQGYHYRARIAGDYTFYFKLDYSMYNAFPNNTIGTNLIALIKGDIQYNSDNGISESHLANDSSVFPVVGGTTEGFGSGNCLYWKSMQVPDTNLAYTAGTIEFKCTVKLEANETVNPVFIGLKDPTATTFNSAYLAESFTFIVKPAVGDWDLDIAKNLPNMKQLDLVKDLLFLFNLFPRYDFVSKSMNLLTFDECLALPLIDLSDRSSTINATQEGMSKKRLINLGYSEDKQDVLVPNYKVNNYFIQDSQFTEDLEFTTAFASSANYNYLGGIAKIFISKGLNDVIVSSHSSPTTAELDYQNCEIMAMHDKDATRTLYYDINWDYGFKTRLGVFNKSKEWVKEITPTFFVGGTPTLDEPTYKAVTPLGIYQFTGNNRTSGNVVPNALTGEYFRTPIWGRDTVNVFNRNTVDPGVSIDQEYYYFNNIATMKFHPLLNYNNTYEKFYKHLVDKNLTSYKAVVDTRLRFSEFKDIVKGGVRRVKWNNDYFLLLGIDKYNLQTEKGELTLLKVVGF